MKRRSFFAIGGLSGAAVTLSACSGGDTKSDSGPITKDTTAELTLFYWDKEQTPTVEANIKAFNEAYPNITVTPSIAAYKEYFTKLRTQAEGDADQLQSFIATQKQEQPAASAADAAAVQPAAPKAAP